MLEFGQSTIKGIPVQRAYEQGKLDVGGNRAREDPKVFAIRSEAKMERVGSDLFQKTGISCSKIRSLDLQSILRSLASLHDRLTWSI